MMRKITTPAKSRSARKTPKRRKSAAAKNPSAAGKNPPAPALAGVRPPPPGQGKRGEQGYLAYLLRQAQAATRLTMERALADLGVTPPQFVVLTMLRAYPGLSGADLARVALLTPQTVGVIIRNLERDRRDPEDAASGAWPGAAVDADPPRRRRCSTNAGVTSMALERRLVAGLGRQGASARCGAGCPKSPQICSRMASSSGAMTLCRAPSPGPLDCPDETA